MPDLSAPALRLFDPRSLPPTKRAEKLPDFLRENELAALFDAMRAALERTPDSRPSWKRSRERDLLMWQVAYHMGLRIFELCKQRVEDVDLTDWFMTVRGGKGNVDATLPIPNCIRELLAKWIGTKTSGWLFPGPHGQLTTRHARNRLKEIAKQTDIPRRVHPHILRASFCTHLLRKKANIVAVQKAMRHKSLATTQRYAGLLPEDLRETMDLL